MSIISGITNTRWVLYSPVGLVLIEFCGHITAVHHMKHGPGRIPVYLGSQVGYNILQYDAPDLIKQSIKLHQSELVSGPEFGEVTYIHATNGCASLEKLIDKNPDMRWILNKKRR